MSDIKNILKERVEFIRPDEEILKEMKNLYKEFSKNLTNKLKKKKINAEVFLGGSFAKDTLMKKDSYDIDVFVRFKGKKDKEISEILGKLLKNGKRVHGSRDYYQFVKNKIIIEVVPVLTIKNPKQAENVTDLSYFHVNYIVKKIKKNNKLGDEIKLAKAFSYAQNCYGAESYIHGFSGYALELLVCHYGSFLGFLKEIVESNKDKKIIIDDGKFFKNKKDVLANINKSKKQSPIILIDPTFKERNASASLNYETFEKFKKVSKEFLKKPSSKFFERKTVFEEFKKYKGVRIVSIKTSKQKGDIAGTKTKKFYSFFLYKLKKEFKIKKSGFEYNENENIGCFYLLLEKKENEVVKGPHITKVKHLSNFKKAHPNSFIKNKYSYVKIMHKLSFEEWIKKFLKDEKKIIKEMSITEIKDVR